MHTPAHQQLLSDAAAVGESGSAERIAAIEHAIKRIEFERPAAFHTDATLAGRRFWHAPRGDAPNAGYITAAKVA